MQINNQQVIQQTQQWIQQVVIGCNFCPFAKKVVEKKLIHYQVDYSITLEEALLAFYNELIRLQKEGSIETSFLIFPNSFAKFEDYLNLIYKSERVIKKNGFEGIFQVASFHPLYQFANTSVEDVTNYTNKSPHPMLHLLREESVEKALEFYPSPEKIPQQNIEFTKQKGLAYMKSLRDSCF